MTLQDLPDACGSIRGYRRHSSRGEPIDQECQDAWRDYHRDRRAGVVKPAVRPVPACGDPGGAARHRRLGQPVDDACRETERTYKREEARNRRRKRRLEQMLWESWDQTGSPAGAG